MLKTLVLPHEYDYENGDVEVQILPEGHRPDIAKINTLISVAISEKHISDEEGRFFYMAADHGYLIHAESVKVPKHNDDGHNREITFYFHPQITV